MRRVVSLYLPTWPTDRLRRRLGKAAPPVETPVAILGRDGRRQVVLAADRSARAAGLVAGMAAAQARAVCADLVVFPADAAGDADALDRLALWALRLYAPVAAADAPDGLVIDVTGAAGRYGGERGLLDDMMKRLRAGAVAARAAVAGTWGAAHALARFGSDPVMIAPSDQTGRWIGSLPTKALRLPDEMISALGALGMDVIEEIESKPRASLALRFGERLTRRLDQAYGRIAEPITPLEAPELIQARRGFPEPIGAPETLARQTQKLTQELCTALETHNLGARIVDLLFHRVDNRIEAVRVAVAKPQRDVKRLTRLLCDKLETVDPGFGVEAMVLSAPQVEPLSWKPAPGDLGQRAQPDVSELVDTLANRLGPGRLYRMAPAQSDVPERSAQKVHPSAPPCGASWPAQWPRPARLLTPPERIETLALLPDQPPASFTWRGVRRRINRADGPERVFAEWWRADEELHAVRDYFQIEDEAGERFWVFRQGDGEQPATGDLSWYLHGVFG